MSMIQRFERGIVVRTSLIDFCSSWTPRTTHVMKRLKQKFDWLRFIARTPAYIGYESLKGLCSRSQCRPTGHCTVMPLSTCGVYTSRRHPVATKTSVFHLGRSVRSWVILPSDCLLLDVVLSLSLALVFGTLVLPTSLQHLLCSLSENA